MSNEHFQPGPSIPERLYYELMIPITQKRDIINDRYKTLFLDLGRQDMEPEGYQAQNQEIINQKTQELAGITAEEAELKEKLLRDDVKIGAGVFLAMLPAVREFEADTRRGDEKPKHLTQYTGRPF